MSNLFQTVEQEAFRAGINPRTKESRAWFRKKVQNMRVGRRALMREDPIITKNKTVIGGMYMFFYDAKHRKTLPYWDSFPLVIAVGPAENGFYGMNLHYLPIALRAKFLDELMGVTTDKKYNENTRFDVTYSFLNRAASMKYFKPCFKHYLGGYLKSGISMVPAPEWEIATFLPVAQFKKVVNPLEVYRDSRKILGSS